MSEQHHHRKLSESAIALGTVRSEERGRLRWVLLLTAAVMAGEGIGYFFTHSLALLNDAVHFLTHFVTIALSYLAILIAARPAPPDKTFRYWRLEVLASLISGISLMPVSAVVLYEAADRWLSPVPIHTGLMLVLGAVGLAVNILSASILHHHSKHDLNIRGAFLHMLADCVSSLGVLAAGAIVHFTQWTQADPLIAAGISVLILVWCISLVRDSGRILLESVPKHMNLSEIEAAMKTVEGVLEVHDLHVWTITSRMYALTAHVRLREDLPVSQTEELCDRLKKLLDERWEINHATLQFEIAPSETLACERGRSAGSGAGAPPGDGRAP